MVDCGEFVVVIVVMKNTPWFLNLFRCRETQAEALGTQMQKQIPFGDDNQKCNRKNKRARTN